MNVRILFAAILILSLTALAACSKSPDSAADTTAPEVSGMVEGGLRVLTIDPASADHHYTIYRGDYVRMQLTSGEGFTVDIPTRETVKAYPTPEGEKPYIKFPDAGNFPFTIGETSGVIEALEFQAAAYREVGGLDAAKVIANLNPVIVDVRTSREFAGGHIEGAILIPVQEIQRRVGELAEHKAAPVFIYCKSGNRSTVAAKVLIDAGFTNVINLRKGIRDWAGHNLPVVK
jgi:rhodanese-related sulfurtransferase